MRSPKCFTVALAPLVCASSPSFTSSMPPSAALFRNARSARLVWAHTAPASRIVTAKIVFIESLLPLDRAIVGPFPGVHLGDEPSQRFFDAPPARLICYATRHFHRQDQAETVFLGHFAQAAGARAFQVFT